MTFDELVDNFTNIMKGVVGDKPNSPSLVQIGVNQFNCFLDEYVKSRYVWAAYCPPHDYVVMSFFRSQQDLVKKLADVKVVLPYKVVMLPYSRACHYGLP